MKKIKYILFTVFAFASLLSCVKDDVENNSKGRYIVGFKNPLASYIYTDNDVEPVQITEPINLIGGSNGTTSNKDIEIKFSIDPSSTAILGTDYELNTIANSLTLVAGSDFVMLPMTINPSVLPDNLPKTIVINLSDPQTTDYVIASDKRTIEITIAKCASNLAGEYSLEVTRQDTGVVYNFPNEIITELSLGVYETSTTGPYFNLTDDGAPRNGFIFKDVCQTIVIDEQFLGDYYSNLVEGDPDSGSVQLNPVTGEVETITMNYSIRGFSSGVARRYFKAVYTKL